MCTVLEVSQGSAAVCSPNHPRPFALYRNFLEIPSRKSGCRHRKKGGGGVREGGFYNFILWFSCLDAQIASNFKSNLLAFRNRSNLKALQLQLRFLHQFKTDLKAIRLRFCGALCDFKSVRFCPDLKSLRILFCQIFHLVVLVASSK